MLSAALEAGADSTPSTTVQKFYAVICAPGNQAEKIGNKPWWQPTGGIYQFSVDPNNLRSSEDAELDIVCNFDAARIEFVRAFPEEGIVIVTGRFGEPRNPPSVLVVHTDTMQQTEVKPEGDFWPPFKVYRIEGHLLLALQTEDHSMLDLESLRVFACPVPVSQLVKHELPHGGVYAKGTVHWPYLQADEWEVLSIGPLPPETMRTSNPGYAILWNDEERLILGAGRVTAPTSLMPGGSYTQGEELPGSRVIYLDRDSEEWRECIFKGDNSRHKIVWPWLARRVGWEYPESQQYGPAFTGEWDLMHIPTGNVEVLHLGTKESGHSDVLLATDDYLIISQGDTLWEIPLEHTGIQEGISPQLSGQEKRPSLSHEFVPYIQGLLLAN